VLQLSHGGFSPPDLNQEDGLLSSGKFIQQKLDLLSLRQAREDEVQKRYPE